MVKTQRKVFAHPWSWLLIFFLASSPLVKGAILPPPTCDVFEEPYDSICLDQTDPPKCTECECPPGSGSGGGGCPSCSRPQGMPVWWVSEPYINLRLEDEPLGYKPARGKRVDFHLSYRQRGNPILDPSIFGVGPNWSTGFRAFVVDLTPYQFDSTSRICLQQNGAGWIEYVNNVQPRNQSSITNLASGGYAIEYSNGARDLFQQRYAIECSGIPYDLYFITATIDPEGNTNAYHYGSETGVLRLKALTDADGNSTSLYYENTNFPCQITRVVDPFQRTNLLYYDASGYLTNIVDVAGMGTSFCYAEPSAIGSGWITNMCSPYGNTSFRYDGENLDESTPFSAQNNTVNRLIEISEPCGAHQLYIYRQNCAYLSDVDSTPFLPDSYADVPVTSPVSNSFDNAAQSSRNSFHWNRLQYTGLSPNYHLSGAWRDLTVQDYKNAGLRHWLKDESGAVSSVLSLERAPSPDGIAEGQLTWYDYPEKPAPGTIGSSALALCSARVFPDGTTRFIHTLRNGHGNVTEQVETYTAPDGLVHLRTNSFVYAQNNIDLLTQRGPVGEQVVSNAFNAFHQASQAFNALNEATVFQYDSATHLLTNLFRPSGLVTRYSYDPATYRLRQSVDDPIHRTNIYSYYTNGLVQTQTDPRGLTITNHWDNLQRLTGVDYPGGSSVSNIYDKLDLVASKDRNGDWTRFQFNALRQKLFETNANNVVTAYGYCDCGALMHLTNALGTLVQEVTSFGYDNQGNRCYTFLPDGTTITNWFDSLGRVTIAADGSVTRFFFYNNQGLIAQVNDLLGVERRTVFDIEDRPIELTDANGMTVTNTYDALGRVLTRLYPDNGVEAFGYSSNILSHTSYTNQINQVVLFTYDEAGRKTHEIKSGLLTNTFVYSAADDLLSLTNGANQSTTWHYDAFGQVTNQVETTGRVALRYAYNPNGQLTNRWSAAKGDTFYFYDPVGNLTVTHYSQSTITNTYDANNRLSTMEDDAGKTTFTYYPGGRLLSEDGPWDNDTISYNYASRLRTGMSIDSKVQTLLFSYAYDSARRLTNVSSPSGNFGYQYPPEHVSPLTSQMTLPNGAAITNVYDRLSRLLGTTLLNGQKTALDSHFYTYNPAHQRTNQTRVIAMGGPHSSYTLATNSVAYTYDPLGQLTAALGSEAASIRRLERFGYDYDPAGNLRNRTNNALVQHFACNGLNQLTNVHRSGTLTVSGTTTSPATNVAVNDLAATLYGDGTFSREGFSLAEGDNTFTAIARDDYGRRSTNTVLVNCPTDINFQYDANGNLTNDGSRTFEYDTENQLHRITLSGQSKSEFVYDGKKRRKVRKEFVWQSGAWAQTDEIHYLYDGNLVVQERWYDNFTAASDPKRTVTYTRGKDLKGSFEGAGGIGGLLAISQLATNSSQWVTSCYHDDGNGNITCLINDQQQIVARYLYDPFGRILSQSGAQADANLYRFSSKEFHPQSGLIYYLYRYDDPSLQRWITKDPKGISELIKRSPLLPSAAAATAAHNSGPGLEIENLYNFVENDPLDRVDALGLWSIIKTPNVPFFFACPTLTGHIYSCSMKVTICICPPKPQLVPCVGHAVEVMLAGCETGDFGAFSMGCGTAKICFDFIQ